MERIIYTRESLMTAASTAGLHKLINIHNIMSSICPL